MRSRAWAVPVLIAVALTATACSKATGDGSQAGGAYGTPGTSTPGTSTPASGMPATSGATLMVEKTKAGTVLAGSTGLTLYYYTADKPGSGKSVCAASCAAIWPPLTAPVKPPAGVRMPGPIGMITRAGGTKQVTINGYPIYYYADDKAPGQDAGNGAEGTWHVIKIPMAASLKAERTSAGTVLASRKGLTLYYYTADKPGSGTSACTGSCAAAWPPLKAPVTAPAGFRLPGPIGMITRAGGVRQVTINGYPIYLYAGDKAPGQVKGNGEGGVWHVIKLKAATASATMPASTPKPTATATAGTGGGY